MLFSVFHLLDSSFSILDFEPMGVIACEMNFWIQHTNGFWIFIQFASLCLLIGVFSPFTFRVNIVMCEFDTAILMFCRLVVDFSLC